MSDIDRVLSLVSSQPVTAADVAIELRKPLKTAHAILGTLVTRGLVKRSGVVLSSYGARSLVLFEMADSGEPKRMAKAQLRVA